MVRFDGKVPELYDTYLVPLIFQVYADDIARRAGSLEISSLLEIAAGTGVVTRALASALPDDVSILATDLNEAMLERARSNGTSRKVDWQQADAMNLPLEDESFDAVICQFGMMFMPDRAHAMSEARRVLRPGGVFIFSVWDRIEENEFADVVTAALESRFPDDPPRFLARLPHGYYEKTLIERDVREAGFTKPTIDTIAARSIAMSPRDPALAYCAGTPLRSEIEERGGTVEEATDLATTGIRARFGAGSVDGKIQAHVITLVR
jgi:ubiquinone/menaquinone biosynthesis C-methylase UbiE